MTPGAKLLVIASALCLLVWGILLTVGVQPLLESGSAQVIYGEHEDFYADAVIYHKARNETSYILHLPRARPSYRWWTVDFADMAITLGSTPLSIGSRRYSLRSDRGGTKIDDAQHMGEWYWHFTETGASFSGNGFTCSVRKTRND
jgi:hypothetical protein